LHNQGVKITLHCFEYGRKHAKELEQFCEKIFYYKRNLSFINLLKTTPFIVNTRSSSELLKNLLLDDAPIIFEGLHSCFFLEHTALENRNKIVRTHNIEHDYYNNLSKVETKFFQKIYLRIEARKLMRFESVLMHAQHIAAISKNDELHFKLQNSNVETISAFHQNTQINCIEGKGKFVLYHGNLSVSENYNAAIFLVENVFCKLQIPFVIAGNNAPQVLKNCVSKYPTISIKENLSTEQIIDLVQQAQINILITQQATGIKLKLLAALYNGRHCVVNSQMVNNTGLEGFCHIGSTTDELKNLLVKYFAQSFTKHDIEFRKTLENSFFSNKINVEKLLKLLK